MDCTFCLKFIYMLRIVLLKIKLEISIVIIYTISCILIFRFLLLYDAVYLNSLCQFIAKQ